jgi:hypothetical protein
MRFDEILHGYMIFCMGTSFTVYDAGTGLKMEQVSKWNRSQNGTGLKMHEA